MCRPRPVQRDQSPSVDSPAEDVFRHKFTLVPHKKLLDFAVDNVFPLAKTTKPVPVRVVAVFEPFVYEYVGGIVI